MNKVIVIGEYCTDKFIYGKIDRLSPEAPVPVLLPIETTENPGMAGNVARNLEAISEYSIEHLHQNEAIVKTRFVEKKTNHMFLRVDDGESKACTKINLEQLNSKIKKANAVVISDYDKGFLDVDDIINISKISSFSILDSKKKLNSDSIHHLDFIKLNEYEAKLNKELIALFPEKFIITLGSSGVLYNGTMYPSPNPQETIDVSGAGDTFVAGFTIKYLETNDVDLSINYANKIASQVVSMRGVNIPNIK